MARRQNTAFRARKLFDYPTIGNERLHRYRAEVALGHPLPVGAVVHHPDEDPWNPNARLIICPSQEYHALLHVRARVLRAGGNPNTDALCGRCGIAKPLSEFSPARARSTGRSNNCRACDALIAAERRRTKAEHLNAVRRARYQRIKDAENAKRRADRLARPEWYREEARRQHANNRETVNARNRDWLAAHKDEVNARRRDRRKAELALKR